jgi:hypothetical protein
MAIAQTILPTLSLELPAHSPVTTTATMSTIASPRSASVASTRRIPSLVTPTTSARPSFDSPNRDVRSTSVSPNRGPGVPGQRRNRVALREFYGLKAQEGGIGSATLGEKGGIGEGNDDVSEVGESEMDEEGFDGNEYVKRVLVGQSLEELLRTYNGLLSGM